MMSFQLQNRLTYFFERLLRQHQIQSDCILHHNATTLFHLISLEIKRPTKSEYSTQLSMEKLGIDFIQTQVHFSLQATIQVFLGLTQQIVVHWNLNFFSRFTQLTNFLDGEHSAFGCADDKICRLAWLSRFEADDHFFLNCANGTSFRDLSAVALNNCASASEKPIIDTVFYIYFYIVIFSINVWTYHKYS